MPRHDGDVTISLERGWSFWWLPAKRRCNQSVGEKTASLEERRPSPRRPSVTPNTTQATSVVSTISPHDVTASAGAKLGIPRTGHQLRWNIRLPGLEFLASGIAESETGSHRCPGWGQLDSRGQFVDRTRKGVANGEEELTIGQERRTCLSMELAEEGCRFETQRVEAAATRP